MEIQHNIQLKSLNTMATPAMARWFTVAQTEDDILQALEFCKQNNCDYLVLGEGSNCVFIDDLDILVIANRIGGAGHIPNLFKSDAVEIVEETDKFIDLVIGAGVNWHQLVKESLDNNFFGLEQLALIPGLVGAAPIQNIGAYGAELKDVLLSVRAINTLSGEIDELSNQQCEFGYRDSFFKRQTGKYIISSVSLRLAKQSTHYQLDDAYPALRTSLQSLSTNKVITAHDIFHAVCEVRRSKLPDPKRIPNTGSFFKNPIVSEEKNHQLLSSFPTIIHYPHTDCPKTVKLAAGWLIETIGLKGFSGRGGVGCYEKQALVIINPKKSKGSDVLYFAEYIQNAVADKFDLKLEIEPRLYRSKQGRLLCLS